MQAQTLQKKVLRTICPDAKGLIASNEFAQIKKIPHINI